MASLTLCDESITYGTVNCGISSRLINRKLKEGKTDRSFQGEIKISVLRRHQNKAVGTRFERALSAAEAKQ